MKHTKSILILLAIAALGGCAAPVGSSAGGSTVVPDSVAKAAIYPPKPTDYKQQVKTYMHVTLKDPDSAQYQNWLLAKAYLECNPPIYGWLVTVEVNAKNSFGAFSGYELQMFWLHGSDLIKPALDMPCKVHVVDLDTAEVLKSLHSNP